MKRGLLAAIVFVVALLPLVLWRIEPVSLSRRYDIRNTHTGLRDRDSSRDASNESHDPNMSHAVGNSGKLPRDDLFETFPWVDVCADHSASEMEPDQRMATWLLAGGRAFLSDAAALGLPDFLPLFGAAEKNDPNRNSDAGLDVGSVHLAIVPKPAKVAVHPRGVRLLELRWPLEISVVPSLCSAHSPVRSAIKRFSDYLQRLCNRRSLDSESKSGAGTAMKVELSCFSLVTVPLLNTSEAYNVSVSKRSPNRTPSAGPSVSLQIDAETSIGVLHGLSTVLQMVIAPQRHQTKRLHPNDSHQLCRIAEANVTDVPRFRWRGVLVDVARRFLPLSRLKDHIEAMAMAKLNVLHIHLTDDQGWRFESLKYPLLHRIGGENQFYSQAQLRELTLFCADRGIRIVPEIDVPGHSGAALAAYPNLLGRLDQPRFSKPPKAVGMHDTAITPIRSAVFSFIFDIFDELAAVFPHSEFIHTGGDEVELKYWQNSEEMRAFSNTSMEMIQSKFSERLVRYMSDSIGRQSIVFSEAVSTTAARDLLSRRKLTVEQWLPDPPTNVLLANGFDVVWSRDMHLDWKRTSAWYLKESSELETATMDAILGVEGCLWSEFIAPELHAPMAWPVLTILAERGWSRRSPLDEGEFHRRMDWFSAFLDRLSIVDHLSTTFKMLLSIVSKQHRMSTKGGRAQNVRDVDSALALQAFSVAATSNGWRKTYKTSDPVNHLVDVVPRESVAARNLDRLLLQMASPATYPLATDAVIRALFGWSLVSPVLRSTFQNFSNTTKIGAGALELARALSVASCAALDKLRKCSRGVLSDASRNRQCKENPTVPSDDRIPSVCVRGVLHDDYPEVQTSLPVCALLHTWSHQ